MPRVVTPELMDDPAVPEADLRASLAFIRAVNRRLGGSAALIARLSRFTRRWPAERELHLLDLGTGSADIPLAVAQWAERTGRPVRILAVDNHATTLRLAAEHIGGHAAIELLHADALSLADEHPHRFRAGSFDIVHAGMFVHHLKEIQALTLLAAMHRLARVGVVWNDLLRSPLSMFGARLMVLNAPAIVRHDALASVRAGFTRAEALDLARRAGWPAPVAHANPLAARLVTTATLGE